MSYFAFGQILYSGNTTDSVLESACWRSTRTGLDLGVHVMLSYNIKQDNVAEMLLKFGITNTTATPFLITASPMEDTSDTLISPYNNAPAVIFDNFRRIEGWISRVLRQPGVEAILLFLTEGYDTEFEEIQIRSGELASVVISKIKEYEDIPSLKLSVAP